MELKESVLELLRQAATDLPLDVEASLKKAYEGEEIGSSAKSVFKTILDNIEMARAQSTPICQDTGAMVFYVDYPEGGIERKFREAIEWAAREATAKQYLRPNAVDPITSKNSGDNMGINAPYIHFHQWQKEDIRIRLLLKGGGSENVGAQYKLPDAKLHAGRDMDGVRKVIIDAVRNAQGLGCAPGILGIGIGGNRDTSYALSKEQLFRKIGDRHEDEEIADMEGKLLYDLNKLQIGPMGFGGNTSILDVLVGSQHRHPATFYVSITYNCWAFRRKSLTIIDGEESYD